MRWGACGHPLRYVPLAYVTTGCRVCELLDRTDGEGVLRHPPAASWRGREDEANAWERCPFDRLVPGFDVAPLQQRAIIEWGMRPRAIVEPDPAWPRADHVRTLFNDAWRSIISDATRVEFDGEWALRAAMLDHVGHTSRNVPAWNEPREVVFLRSFEEQQRLLNNTILTFGDVKITSPDFTQIYGIG